MRYPEAIQKLINLLGQLPTVGPKTAERYALFLLRQNPAFLNDLTASLQNLQAGIVICNSCHALASASPCAICADPKRQTGTLCVVAETKDMIALEDSRAYGGLYHILGGTISTINNLGPEKLNINSLINKIKNNNYSEIILALNPDLEGETTALYLKKLLAAANIPVTRLARGMSSGSSLDYADELTIANALKYRNKF